MGERILTVLAGLGLGSWCRRRDVSRTSVGDAIGQTNDAISTETKEKTKHTFLFSRDSCRRAIVW